MIYDEDSKANKRNVVSHFSRKQPRARITHIGRGKFRILEDERGEYSEQEINASDVLHCRD